MTIETRQPIATGRSLLALRGEHQIGNAVVAVRLLEAARDTGVAMPPGAIARGLETVDWPARLELLRLADGRACCSTPRTTPKARARSPTTSRRWHPERPALVIGVMRDKDVDGDPARRCCRSPRR